MSDFVTIDIEYLHSQLSEISITDKDTLYDVLLYMTRFCRNVYLIKLKDGRYRAVYDIHHEIFEGDGEVETLYKMVMSFIENDESYIVIPPKIPCYMIQSEFDEIYGKPPSKLKIKYIDMSK